MSSLRLGLHLAYPSINLALYKTALLHLIRLLHVFRQLVCFPSPLLACTLSNISQGQACSRLTLLSACRLCCSHAFPLWTVLKSRQLASSVPCLHPMSLGTLHHIMAHYPWLLWQGSLPVLTHVWSLCIAPLCCCNDTMLLSSSLGAAMSHGIVSMTPLICAQYAQGIVPLCIAFHIVSWVDFIVAALTCLI